MAHSIELRVQLLDHLLVEAGCRLPSGSRVSSEVNKPSLVEAIDDPSIRAAARRPKRGFVLPFARWMAAHAGEMEERALQGDLLDPATVRDCWKDFRAVACTGPAPGRRWCWGRFRRAWRRHETAGSGERYQTAARPVLLLSGRGRRHGNLCGLSRPDTAGEGAMRLRSRPRRAKPDLYA